MRLCVQGVAFFLFPCFRVASVGFISREEDSLGESTVLSTRPSNEVKSHVQKEHERLVDR